MKKGIIVSVIIVLALIVIGTFLINNSDKDVDTSESENLPPLPPGFETENIEAVTWDVKITENGFEPKLLEINEGDIVQWTNEVGRQSWPASAVHPSHTLYPGSGIEKCETNQEEEIFDACRGLGFGGIYRFVFTEKGNWNYHDHLKSSVTGTIIVK